MYGMTPDKAYTSGFSMSLANKTKPVELRVMLLAELERLTRHVNATRTFQTQTDLQDAVDDICELFPSLKIEEILTAFKHIRQGRFPLFGNFTTNTMLDCIRKYEMENTVSMREQEHKERKEVLTASLDIKRLIADLDKDGKLKTSRQILDRKYIPYPNDKTDYTETQEQKQHEQKAEEKAGAKTK
tara:strand:+ start:5405 stop:5962 length:558 start_codon:yes stop_codon:yes gene_type:complete